MNSRTFANLETGFAPLEPNTVREYSLAPSAEIAICRDCGRKTFGNYAAEHEGRCAYCSTSGWRDSDDWS